MMKEIYKLLRRRTAYVCGGEHHPRRQGMVDAGLAVLVAASSCALLTRVHATGLVGSYAASCVVAAAGAAGLMWRRSRPELSVAVAVAATLASDENGALLAASYAVGLYGRRHRALIVALATLVYVGTRTSVGGFVDDPGWRLYVVVLTIWLPALFGQFVRRQRLLKERLDQRLSQVESSVDQAVRFAILEQRTRLAFEVHDTVGHHATHLMLRASGARRLPGLTSEAEQAITELQDGAVLVMRELRQVIDVLREDGPQDGLGGRVSCGEFLESLTRNMRAVGMDASYGVRGTVRALGARGESLLLRVCREALTNAAKHAPGAPVRMELVFDAHSAALVVRNGPPPHRRSTDEPAGLGLTSLRQAVTEAGGRFRAGPAEDGGFRVDASVPADGRV
ncbi:sensor histidine kinase [Streptomyces sp. IBSNAI002]|uniref:sensor histidine kinase n=1 Tax=Streptomyces sp. IBSNAI002 TaxID=3457500 RepID=UPI003FD0702F